MEECYFFHPFMDFNAKRWYCGFTNEDLNVVGSRTADGFYKETCKSCEECRHLVKKTDVDAIAKRIACEGLEAVIKP